MSQVARRALGVLLLAALLAVMLVSTRAQRADCERSGGRIVHVDGGRECWHGVIPW